MATALTSPHLTNIPVSRQVAMTGEISLRGRVLPIGGLKEIFGRTRAGIRKIVIPKDNERDLPANSRKLVAGASQSHWIKYWRQR